MLICANNINKKTRNDTDLRKIIQLLELSENLKKHAYIAPKASAVACLVYEYQVIPDTLRNHILAELHAEHLGIVKMKGMARL